MVCLITRDLEDLFMIDQGNDRIIATFDGDSGLRDARDLLTAAGFADTDIRWVTNDQPMAGTSGNPRIGEEVSLTNALRQPQHRGFFAKLFGLDDESVHKHADLGINGEDVRFAEGDRHFVGLSQTGKQVLIVEARGRASEAERIIRRAGGTVDAKAVDWYNKRLQERFSVDKKVAPKEEIGIDKRNITETKRASGDLSAKGRKSSAPGEDRSSP